MKKIIVFCVAFLATMSLWASETSVNAIWYDFDSIAKTASVTYRGYAPDDFDEYIGEVVIPSTVTYKDEEYSVTSIGNDAFDDCASLTSITIPGSVTSIGNAAFYECLSLTSITIPGSVTWIGDNAFNDCSSLTSIDVALDNSSYTSIDGVLFNKDKTFLIKYPEGKKDVTSYEIPESVTEIRGYAFDDCASLTSITLPSSLTSIGWSAFFGCSSLTSITLPESVTWIGDDAFLGCSSLTSITIPEGVTLIGHIAFGYCSSLTSIDVAPNNENYASIDGVLFSKDKTILIQYPQGKDATSYTIPEGVTEIRGSAFEGCSSLTSITLPSSLTLIECSAFKHCSSLTSITIPEGVTEICNGFRFCSSLTSIDVALNNENYASIDGVLFSKDKTILIQYPQGKDATSYIIPEGVTEIEYNAFDDCASLTSITIPGSVTWIGDGAFYDCLSLKSITIPESVTEIGDFTFSGCSSLTSITCKNTTPPTLIESEYDGENFTFEYVDKSIPLYVPAESVEVYKKTKYWKDFTNIQAIPSSSVANAKAETQDSVRKEYRDGQVLIIKGDKTYTMFGTEY